MGEVYFVRHGQASYGAADYDKLSPLGHQQAEWLGSHLAATVDGFDRIVSGSLRRHRETLSGILKSVEHGSTEEDARLNEMSYFAMEQAYIRETGDQAPENRDEIAEFFRRVLAAWESGAIDGAPEPYEQFRTRILAALTEYASHGERVLVVSSGGPIGIALAHVLGLDLHAMTDIILHTLNASYSRFLVHNQGLRLIQFNVISHLEQTDRQHAQTYL